MKRWLIAPMSGLLLAFTLVIAEQHQRTCRVSLTLVDAVTSKTLSGLIRLRDRDGNLLTPRTIGALPFLPRGQGVADQPELESWSVVIGSAQLELPQVELTIEAFAGLDTELHRSTLDLRNSDTSQRRVPLNRFCDAAKQGLHSANTHLHLMKLDRTQADRYLREIPSADRLDILFVSYLERADADHDYISNRYTRNDLQRLTEAGSTIFGNGEEHRHNFGSHGPGYGHVMLLNIPELIPPVSIGLGITKTGTDGTPLQRGIDRARQLRGTAIWCHNNLGLERLANLMTGRLDAQNIYDGSRESSYKDSFYRGLNVGLKIPFSTGTDWFIFDFSRTYARVDGPLTAENWLKALSAGRSFITNGPFLEFRAAGIEPGGQVSLSRPGTVHVEARGIGRVDFQRIELIQNGTVIRSQGCHPEAGHHVADMKIDLDITAPCWLALRIPPPPVKNDPELTAEVPLNEYGKSLYAHTSAIDIGVQGRRHFDKIVAEELRQELRNALAQIIAQGQFADDVEKTRVADVYLDAIAELERRMAAAKD